MTAKELWDALTEYRGGEPEALDETTSVLSYEVGAMLEQAMYLRWHTGDKEETIIRRAFYKSELIDAIAMIHLICVSLGVDYGEMKAMGFDKAMRRFTKRDYKGVQPE